MDLSTNSTGGFMDITQKTLSEQAKVTIQHFIISLKQIPSERDLVNITRQDNKEIDDAIIRSTSELLAKNIESDEGEVKIDVIEEILLSKIDETGRLYGIKDKSESVVIVRQYLIDLLDIIGDNISRTEKSQYGFERFTKVLLAHFDLRTKLLMMNSNATMEDIIVVHDRYLVDHVKRELDVPNDFIETLKDLGLNDFIAWRGFALSKVDTKIHLDLENVFHEDYGDNDLYHVFTFVD